MVNYSSSDGRTVPNDDNDAWVKPAFREIFRVLRWNRFCVSFYSWNKADKFLAAWREAGFRIAGHLTFIKKYASTERFLRYQHENAYLLAKGNPHEAEFARYRTFWNGNTQATIFIRLKSRYAS